MPPIMVRSVLVFGLLGILLGVAIGFHNDDSLGVSLLRASVMGVFFAYCTRFLMQHLMTSWLEAKLEDYAKRKEEARIAAEEEKERVDREKAEAAKLKSGNAGTDTKAKN